MSPKIIDKTEKRQIIIEAALRVFAKTGFARTKMAHIAEAAGIGKGTIYEYFKSKEDLVRAVFHVFVIQSENEINKRVDQYDDPVQKLNAYFEAWESILNEDFMEYADLMLDIWSESVRFHEGKDVFNLKAMYARLRVQLSDILKKGMKSGRFKQVDPSLVSSVILATFDGLFLQWLLDKKAFDPLAAVNEMKKIFIDGILI